MRKDRSRVAPVIWLGAVSVLAVTVGFAPVVTGGWCADAPIGETSTCGTFQRSVLGIDTSIWLWLALSGMVILATVLAARRCRQGHR